MKNKLYILLSILVFASCVYESGTNKTNRNIGIKTNTSSQNEITEPNTLNETEVFEKCNAAVFMIQSDSLQGSGFFISNNGLAVSNYHIIAELKTFGDVIVMSNGDRYNITSIVDSSKYYDYAVFRVNCYNNNYLVRNTTHTLSVGDKVYTISSPLGMQNTLSSGEVSQIRDKYIIQISNPIDQGSSGGALINEYGEVIGIISFHIPTSKANLNFAISSKVLPQINEDNNDSK